MSERIAPTGKLDVGAVRDLQAGLVRAQSGAITLDLSQVTLFGALCAQTCLAAARDAKARGDSFDIVGASDQVLGQLAAMGMTPERLAEGRI